MQVPGGNLLPPVQKLGSDATAAGDRQREQSEWPRSAAEEAALAATKMPGTATGGYNNFRNAKMHIESCHPDQKPGVVSYCTRFWYILLPWVNTNTKGVIFTDGQELVKQTLDQIPQASTNAKKITGLVKEGGRITGYQLSDNTIVAKQQAVNMAKQGQIAGVGIAHRGDTEYLKSIPDGSENNNLGNLPSVSPQS